MLVPDEQSALETTVTGYQGWSKQSGEWVEFWHGKDQDGQKYDLDAEDVYTGLGFETSGEMIGKELIHNGHRATIVAYLPPTEDEPMELWKIHFVDGEREDLDEVELNAAIAKAEATIQ